MTESSTEKQGFFKRIFTKIDTAMKEKAEQQGDCCCETESEDKSGECCSSGGEKKEKSKCC